MDDYRTRIAQEFSTFHVPGGLMTSSTRRVQRDRPLQRMMEALADSDLEVPHDAWARYFLLTLLVSDADYYATLKPPQPKPYQLDALISYWVHIAPQPNGNTELIGSQLTNRQHTAPIQEFLAKADTFAKKLLSLYLQPKCAHIARRALYQTEEYFAIALDQINAPKTLLQQFNFAHPHTSIRTYAESVLKWSVPKAFRARDVAKQTASMGNEGLLKRLSNRDFQQALRTSGKPPDTILSYRTVLSGFQAVYSAVKPSSNQQRLPPPTPEQIQAIGHYYHTRRQDLPQLPALAIAQIQPILTEISQLVRNYHNPDSWNQRVYEHTNAIADPWDAMETTTGRDTLYQHFHNAFSALPLPIQHLLHLRYGLALTGADICTALGSQLQVKEQYEISRLLKKTKRQMLQHILEALTAQGSINISKKWFDQVFDNVAKSMDDYLADTLCGPFFYPALQQAIATLPSHEQQWLHGYHRLRLDSAQLAERFGTSASTMEDRLVQLQIDLQAALIGWIETTLNISIRDCRSLSKRASEVVIDYLEDYESWTHP